MVDAQSFLDNLENARLAMSVALEHTQENRDQFVKNGTGLRLKTTWNLVTQKDTFRFNLRRIYSVSILPLARSVLSCMSTSTSHG